MTASCGDRAVPDSESEMWQHLGPMLRAQPVPHFPSAAGTCLSLSPVQQQGWMLSSVCWVGGVREELGGSLPTHHPIHPRQANLPHVPVAAKCPFVFVLAASDPPALLCPLSQPPFWDWGRGHSSTKSSSVLPSPCPGTPGPPSWSSPIPIKGQRGWGGSSRVGNFDTAMSRGAAGPPQPGQRAP